MPSTKELESVVDGLFGTTFNERDGRVVPESKDVALANGAVKIDATFLYADLAGSAQLSKVCPWSTTAKIIRAFLECSTRLIRARGGHIRSFDGDRVMGVFMGDAKNSDAADCAREIYYTVLKIINPKAKSNFQSVRNNGIEVRHGCGIDAGIVRAVRAGIRNNNDLIWVGKPASLSAKLSDCREYPHCTLISKPVYDKLRDSSKFHNGENMWESRSYKFAGSSEPVYRSSWWKKP